MSRLPFFILSFKVILPLPNHRFEELGSETTRSGGYAPQFLLRLPDLTPRAKFQI